MKEKKRFKRILFIFKICYLVYLLLAFNAFVNGTVWMNKASYVITVLGGGMILWMLFRYKRYRKAYNLWMLVAFAVSYLLSAVTHLSYGGMTENAKGMIWLVLPFVLVYLSAFDMSEAEIRQELKWLSGIYIFYCSIANLVSLSMVYWGQMYDHIDATGFVHGIGYRWSRLWGVYDDPNHGATITIVALFMLIYFFFRSKKLWQRISYLLIFVLNYLYVVLSDSRTGMVALGIGIFGGGILLFWLKKKDGITLKRAIVPLLCGVLVVGFVFAGDVAVKSAYKSVNQEILKVREKAKKIAHQPKTDDLRKKDLQRDYSNGRLEIWKNALQIVQKSPVIGVGFRNIKGYAKEHFPSGYLVKNAEGVKYDSMHNLELDVLVGQGVLGGILFLLLIGNCGVILYKRFHLVPLEYRVEAVCAAAIVGTLLAAGMFLSFIFYVNAPQSICFWLFLGYTMRFCQIGAEENNETNISRIHHGWKGRRY